MLSSQRPAGMPCPNCSSFIPMDVAGLISGRPFVCQNVSCRTVIHLDQSRSRRSVEILSEFRDVLERAERANAR